MNDTVDTELIAGYDLVIFDLDGVLYAGDQPIGGAAPAVAKLHERGLPTVYATNNASRSAPDVAALLTKVGVPAQPAEVLTSAGATAALLAQRYPKGTPVMVVGAAALVNELTAVGLTAVPATTPAQSAAMLACAAGDGRGDDAVPVAVVQGYGQDVGWTALAAAAVLLRGGAAWFATNADRTLPSPYGPLPGNGSLVGMLAIALDRQPDVVVGKPDPGLFRQAVQATGASRPLVVGDRLDTDIEGANAAGYDSLLVLTGVCQPGDLRDLPPEHRPTYVARDLGGLFSAPLRYTDELVEWLSS